jgi:hypothetical protein
MRIHPAMSAVQQFNESKITPPSLRFALWGLLHDNSGNWCCGGPINRIVQKTWTTLCTAWRPCGAVPFRILSMVIKDRRSLSWGWNRISTIPLKLWVIIPAWKMTDQRLWQLPSPHGANMDETEESVFRSIFVSWRHVGWRWNLLGWYQTVPVVNHINGIETRRELNVVWNMFRVDPLSPFGAYTHQAPYISQIWS